MSGNCKRKQKREVATNEFLFSVLEPAPDCGSTEGRRTGVLIDRSSTGLGFTTDGRLEPGSRIRMQVQDSAQVGVVMWTVNAEDQCRVGVHLLDHRQE